MELPKFVMLVPKIDRSVHNGSIITKDRMFLIH